MPESDRPITVNYVTPRFGGAIMAVRRNPGGRPSKFTTAAALAVVTELCQGESLEAAAKSAGDRGIDPVPMARAGPPG